MPNSINTHVTTTKERSIQTALDSGNPNEIGDGLRQAKVGTILEPLKVTFSGLTAAAAINITTLASLAAATVNQGDIQAASGQTTGYVASGTPLPAIGTVKTLRVTAGAAAAGPRVVTDAGGAASAPGASGPGIALISDDGKTLTFEGNVTGFVLEYMPRPAVDLSTTFFAPET